MAKVKYYTYDSVAQRVHEVLQIPRPTAGAVRNAVMLQRRGQPYSGFGIGIPQPLGTLSTGRTNRTYFSAQQIESWLQRHPWRKCAPLFLVRQEFNSLWQSGRHAEAMARARRTGIPWRTLTDWRNEIDNTKHSLSATYREFRTTASGHQTRYYSYSRVAQRVHEVLQIPRPTAGAVRNAVMLQRRGQPYSGFGIGIPQPLGTLSTGRTNRTYFSAQQIESWLQRHPWRKCAPLFLVRQEFNSLWQSGRHAEAMARARRTGIPWRTLTDWRNEIDNTKHSLSATYREFRTTASGHRGAASASLED